MSNSSKQDQTPVAVSVGRYYREIANPRRPSLATLWDDVIAPATPSGINDFQISLNAVAKETDLLRVTAKKGIKTLLSTGVIECLDETMSGPRVYRVRDVMVNSISGLALCDDPVGEAPEVEAPEVEAPEIEPVKLTKAQAATIEGLIEGTLEGVDGRVVNNLVKKGCMLDDLSITPVGLASLEAYNA